MARVPVHNSGITPAELDMTEHDLSLDPDGILDDPDELEPLDPEPGVLPGDELKDLEQLEIEELQRPDPAEDDLPDRAFDRIAPGV